MEVNRRALAINPNLVFGHYNEGLAHLYLGEIQKEVACFRRVVQLDPKNAGGHYHLAVGLFAAGEVDEARVSFAVSLQLGWSPDPGLMKALERHDGVDFGQAPVMESGSTSKKSPS